MEGTVKPDEKVGHLLCGRPVRAFGVAVVCAIFLYLSFSYLRNGDFFWQNGWWSVLTWIVWLVLVGAIVGETRCRRERLLLALVMAILSVGLIFSIWKSAPMGVSRFARMLSLLLWSASLLVALGTMRRAGPPQEIQ